MERLTKNQQLWLAAARRKAKLLLGVLLAFAALVPLLVLRQRQSEAVFDHNQGLSFYYKHRYAQAIQKFQEETRLVPSFSGGYDCWELAVEGEGNLPQAIVLYRKAPSIDPKSSNARTNLALVLLKQGHQQEGLSELQAAVQGKPEDGIAHRDLGTLYHRLGRQEDAEQQWQEAARDGDETTLAFLKKHSIH